MNIRMPVAIATAFCSYILLTGSGKLEKKAVCHQSIGDASYSISFKINGKPYSFSGTQDTKNPYIPLTSRGFYRSTNNTTNFMIVWSSGTGKMMEIGSFSGNFPGGKTGVYSSSTVLVIVMRGPTQLTESAEQISYNITAYGPPGGRISGQFSGKTLGGGSTITDGAFSVPRVEDVNK